MHVVIVGCGRVGSALARSLTEGGHTVAIIDKRPEAFGRLPHDFSGQIINGIGFDRDRLIEAGIEEAASLAAVTNGDNSNILIARVARETFGIENVVARIYDPRRAAIYQRLGIATVATVAWTTERVMRRIAAHGSRRSSGSTPAPRSRSWSGRSPARGRVIRCRTSRSPGGSGWRRWAGSGWRRFPTGSRGPGRRRGVPGRGQRRAGRRRRRLAAGPAKGAH